MKALFVAFFCSLVVHSCYQETNINHIQPKPDTDHSENLEDGIDTNVEWFKPEEIKEIKSQLNITIPTEKPTLKLDTEERKEVILSFKNGLEDRLELAKKTDKALNNAIKYAVFTLKRKGLDDKAKQIETEYLERYRNFAFQFALGSLSDIGDHPPLWIWLDVVEKELRAALGDVVMKTTRLEDLRTFNYGLPIVLSPAGDERFDPPVMISKLDYKQHFVPFAGILGYWTAWGVCTGATYGAGSITFICSPIGSICERVIKNKIAPPMSDSIWDSANQ